jgi:hypothetical protein
MKKGFIWVALSYTGILFKLYLNNFYIDDKSCHNISGHYNNNNSYNIRNYIHNDFRYYR